VVEQRIQDEGKKGTTTYPQQRRTRKAGSHQWACISLRSDGSQFRACLFMLLALPACSTQ